MSVAVQIRLARLEDIAALVVLERGVECASHWAKQEYAAMLEPGEGAGIQRRLIVAERGGDLIGFVVGKVVVQNLAEIESVAVAEDARRMGVGRGLCEAVIGWFRDAGAKAVELEVRAGNDGAIVLYQRLGFVVMGRRKGYYREPIEDALLMSMALS
jgi:ribosomal-protein-alanine N-acetyltransferase